MSKPALLSIGTATPAGVVAQAAAADLACAITRDETTHRTIRALYRRAGVRTRGSVLAGRDGSQSFYLPDGDGGPGTAARMAAYGEHAGALAESAGRDALEKAGLAPRRVTHVVTATCTGFHAPGPDQHLLHALALPPTARRTSIGFMGCHAAVNALATAAAYAAADPSARVLVCCVELCSLHFAYDAEPERLVANALFADGAAAAVVGQSDTAPARIARTDAVILPDCADLMTWDVGDHGFAMRLSARVPDVLARHVPAWVRGWLDAEGLRVEEVPSWAIHPGGPRVLSSVREALGLPPEAEAASREVLAEHGNMSSATVLFIIDRLLRSGSGLPLAAMAFGPGLAGESVLLTRG